MINMKILVKEIDKELEVKDFKINTNLDLKIKELIGENDLYDCYLGDYIFLILGERISNDINESNLNFLCSITRDEKIVNQMSCGTAVFAKKKYDENLGVCYTGLEDNDINDISKHLHYSWQICSSNGRAYHVFNAYKFIEKRGYKFNDKIKLWQKITDDYYKNIDKKKFKKDLLKAGFTVKDK